MLKKKNWLFIPVMVLIAACAPKQTYTGERLPPEQVARIQQYTNKIHLYYTRTLYVTSVDGLRPSFLQADYEVLPGQHVLAVKVSWQTTLLAAPFVAAQNWRVNTNSLTFEAEAGHRYRLNGEEGPNKIYYVWLEDADTGSIVAGTRPGANPVP